MRWEPATAARQIGQRMSPRTTARAQSALKAAWTHGRSAAGREIHGEIQYQYNQDAW
jgi:hypothetical protein